VRSLAVDITINAIDLNNMFRHDPSLLGQRPVQRDSISRNAVQRYSWRRWKVKPEDLDECRNRYIEERCDPIADPSNGSVRDPNQR
jgi:hypothetical protein